MTGMELLQPKLERYLDLLSVRQRLVASNIANIDTPGYHTRDIDFQFEFMSLAEGSQPNIIEPEGLTGKNDGNNVSMDREARLLAENALRFQFASQLLKGELSSLKSAIHGGNR
jgi:flagellar basal-body rod protein FlgB